MKVTTPLTTAAILLIATTSSWAQCSGGGVGTIVPTYQPTSYSDLYTCPISTPTYGEPIPTVEPFEEEPLDEGFFEEAAGPQSPVEYEVRVQHPVSFAWKTIKIFADPELADAYATQIESRYWVLYGDRGAKPKYLEAGSLTEARSTAKTLRRSGAAIKSIDAFQVEVAEESLQDIFDGAIAEGPATSVVSKVPNELQPLLGLWEAVTKTADGQLSRILLNLNADGTAEMTVPTAAGGEVKINREFAVAEGEFKLTDGESELVLGGVLEAGAEKVVLDRNGAKITFLRP